MTSDQSEDRTGAGTDQGPGDDPRLRSITTVSVVGYDKTDWGAESGSDNRSQQGAVPPFARLLQLRAARTCQRQPSRTQGQES